MSTQTTTLGAMQNKQQQIAPAGNFEVGFASSGSFDLMQRAAKLLAASSLVPKEYQGNIANCTIALNMAVRVGADPLMVMQNLVIVHGRPTWSSQFLISTVNTCGRFTALRYEFFGEPNTDSWGCRAWAIEKSTGEKLVGTDVTIALAKAEGWYGKNGSKWKTMPQQMLMYRSGSWWTRAYAPELSMGLHTKEEMLDVYDAERLEDGSYSVKLDELRQQSEHPQDEPKPDAPSVTGEIIEPTKTAKKTEPTASEKLTKLIGLLKKSHPDQRVTLFVQNNGQELFEDAGCTPEDASALSELGIKMFQEAA